MENAYSPDGGRSSNCLRAGLRVGSSSILIICLEQLISDFDRHAKVRPAKALITIDRGKYRGVDRNNARVAIEDRTARSAFGRLCTMNDAAWQRIADRPCGREGSYQTARSEPHRYRDNRLSVRPQNLALLGFFNSLKQPLNAGRIAQ